jgi:hypothetical protein
MIIDTQRIAEAPRFLAEKGIIIDISAFGFREGIMDYFWGYLSFI